MLNAVTTKSEIAQCQKRLERALKTNLPDREQLRIGHQGGSFEETVFHGPGLWYATFLEDDAEIPRHWNGLGEGKGEHTDQIIAVEINAPLTGYEARVSGLFARDDESGDYVLLHRGRVGGGRKGIGKLAFRRWSRHEWVEVAGPEGARDEAILVARLASPDIATQIRTFVAEVAAFKREAAAGNFTRTPPSPTKIFSPEFHGKKKGHRAVVLEYESFHGLVVNTLSKKLKTKGGSKYHIFNNAQIDLGIQVGGTVRHIYEVKSSAELHAIYTGTGQLMLNSPDGVAVERTLVLPKGELAKKLHRRLTGLGIGILEYRIKDGKVTFPP